MADTIMKARLLAILVAGSITLAALILVVDRGGLVAWCAFLAGGGLLFKVWRKPSDLDLALSIGLIAVSVLAWVGSWYYVISTWESGEVVELAIDTDAGVQTARVWVMDIGQEPLVYYDAEPEVARSLLAGNPLQLVRAGETSTRIPQATEVDVLPEDEAKLILELMESKYGDRVEAATIYYAMLGRSRDRIAVVARLVAE